MENGYRRLEYLQIGFESDRERDIGNLALGKRAFKPLGLSGGSDPTALQGRCSLK
jgi:hypothetical protein